MVAFIAWCLLPLMTPIGETGDGTSSGGNTAKRTFASVFIVRGSVSGRSTGQFGVFTRNGDDTTWALQTLSNVMTFGLAYFERGETRRYYIAGGNGVHRSTDGGRSWRILTSWRTMEILSVVCDPEDSAVVYAATPWGVYKTTDDGQSWIIKDQGCRRWFAQKLIIDVRDRRTVYAAMEDDLYRSRDGGESWTPLRVGARGVQVVAQNPVDPATIAVGVEDGGVRISRDDGETWEETGGMKGMSVYALRFALDGASVIGGGWKTGVWRSLDGGRSWARLWYDPAVEAVFDVAIDPDDPAHLLVATDGQGVYESHDRGNMWQRAGLMGAKVKQVQFYR